MKLPKIIDNERFQLLEVIKQVSGDYKNLSVATGYWDLKAMEALGPELEKFEKIRILIGCEPQISRSQIAAPEKDFPSKYIEHDLEDLAPDASLREAALNTKNWLKSGKLEVKIYRRSFLHAKTYIFGAEGSTTAVGIIGSSNFTLNGLTTNTELNELESDTRVVLFQPRTPKQEASHYSWFESKWNDELNESWNETLISVLQNSPVGDLFFSPYESYIKTLHDLYKEELEDDDIESGKEGQGKTLFEFQQKNINSLIRKLKKYGVAMLSDSVGLGKTSTSIGVIKTYLNDPDGKKRVEIICPKSIVTQWEKELTEEGVLGYRPITLQNAGEIERKQELDAIASVSLFVIDESHNLRNSGGVRFQQMLDWIRANPKAHVLLVTATPINNSLIDISNQILLGAGGKAGVMTLTVVDENKQTVQITFFQAIENLMKKINQDLKRTNKIDFQYVRSVMTPIIRAFVVRRTRQGIQKEYGSLIIDGKKTSFPKVMPYTVDYEFTKDSLIGVAKVGSEMLPLDLIYSLDPEEIAKTSYKFLHPTRQLSQLKKLDEDNRAKESAMFYVFQLILLLGFLPYRWRLYETNYYGKTKDQIRELGLNGDVSRSLLQQVGIFGILRTIFLKRMESSVSAMQTSLDTYARKLDFFSDGLANGVIYSITDFAALEASWDDDDEAFSSSSLEERVVAIFDEKSFAATELREDIEVEKEIVRVLQAQLKILGDDDSKVRELVARIQGIEAKQPDSKVLVFSYFSDTVSYLESKLPEFSPGFTSGNAAFVSSSNGSDSEKMASLFSPVSKKYSLKDGERELQYLVATDVLSEGQNLQDAGILINYDLHWNPVRMIQRNGRVNRLGTKFKEVSIYNMRPESKLDSYLRLIQRLQGKIDMIRNTIGTDTPVLDEPHNPIEYADSIRDIYSSELQKRIKAIEDAEKAADFLLAEDDYVYDLLNFHKMNSENVEYRESIYNIPKGKWAITPEKVHRGEERPSLMALAELVLDSGDVSHQFIQINQDEMSIQALSTLQALEWLKTDPEDQVRLADNMRRDRVAVAELVSLHAKAYLDEVAEGAPIGQENDLLRLLHANEYAEEEINMVRAAFKTRDLFHKRKINQLKRSILTLKKTNGSYHSKIDDLIKLAKQISRESTEQLPNQVQRSSAALIYSRERS